MRLADQTETYIYEHRQPFNLADLYGQELKYRNNVYTDTHAPLIN